MRPMQRLSSLWPMSWLLVLPLLAGLGTWGYRTVDMYQELSLRNMGDQRIGGLTLHRAGELQFKYMMQAFRLEVSRALARQDEGLPRVHLFVQESDLARLDAARPKSGKQYVPGRLYNNGEFSRVKVRYRGDFAYHWGFFKRSFRVRTKRDDLFLGFRKFNVIAPKTASLYSNHMGYEMARMINLLAPRSTMVNLNVNGKHKGVHLLVEQITETTMRDSGRLPGDIYSGDELYGLDTWTGVGQPLFESAGVWDKVAYNNHYPQAHAVPLEQLLLALKTRDQSRLEKLLDFESFAALNLWEHLANSQHIDNKHNWRLYYDPGRGKFYPIVWDGIPWTEFWQPEQDISSWQPPAKITASILLEVLHENEKFTHTKNRVFSDFLYSDKPDQLIQSLQKINQRMARSVQTDTAILDERLRWITPEESLHQMQRNIILVDHIIDNLRAHYPKAVKPMPQQEPQELIWQGNIHLSQTTTINQPLTIKAGAHITLAKDVSLFIFDRVSINGTDSDPVVFSGKNDAIFGTVVIEGRNADGSRINHLKMSGGSGYKDDLRNYSGMFSIHDVRDIEIQHMALADNHLFDDQFHVVYSTLTLKYSSFTRAPMDAIDLDMSDAVITDCSFVDNGNDGLDLMGANVTASGLSFLNNGDKGISVGERSVLEIKSSTLESNKFGIQVKDDSFASASDLVFKSNQTAIDAYHKNWRYGTGGYGVFCNSQFKNNGKIMTADKKSRLDVDATTCPKPDQVSVSRIKSELANHG